MKSTFLFLRTNTSSPLSCAGKHYFNFMENIICNIKGKDEITSYAIKGEIRNSTINITAWPISKYQLDSANFLMKIYSVQGLRLTGTLSFVSSIDNLVQAEKVEAKMVRS